MIKEELEEMLVNPLKPEEANEIMDFDTVVPV
jgi:hypothetical protein